MDGFQLLEEFNAILLLNNAKNEDVVTFLKTLNAFQASEANTNAFDDVILMKFEALLLKFDDESANLSSMWTELFRFLRNYVALSNKRQNDIVRSTHLFEASIHRVLYLINELSSSSSSLSMISELRCGIQFLGNLVTDNDSNKRILAIRVLSKANVLLSYDDETLKKYTSMLIYNIFYPLEDVRETFLYSSHNAEMIVSSFLLPNSSEWCWFAIEYFLESSMFLEIFYPRLESPERITLLDVLHSILNVSERSSEMKVPFSNLSFLATRFVKNADVILQMKEPSSELFEPLEIMRCLNVLCSASVISSFIVQLQSVPELLCTTIVLLRSIHMAGKETSTNCFTPIETFESDHSISPSDGLKCLLIRLVSNLCWRNKTNQDKVREFDGIPLLLDCCKLDAKNHFIIQCVIFAIRNLCEDNAENQKLIASMDKKELPPTSLVQELGYEVSEDFTKRPVTKSNCDAQSKIEQAKQDIRDLFL